ncbi:MAG: glycoside hydrolase family 43 protein [Odoribacteraceae bacterium]|jgi:hypothetical protein|nr:glycoside hydrolase family 43 protein [Odoribacteraceae bacterium]
MKTHAIILLAALSLSCGSRREEIIFTPGAPWPDNNGVHINAHGGGILQRGDIYYWYGEHKVAGAAGNVAREGVRCYSSRDLLHWTDEGIVLPVVKGARHSPVLEEGCIIERPKVIYNSRTKKYVMWFHYEPANHRYDCSYSGVATADSPTGRFKLLHYGRQNAGCLPLNALPLHASRVYNPEKNYPGGSLPRHPDSLNLIARDFDGGQMARDMTLFLDDDGKAYHIYSSENNSTLHVSLLDDDYTNYSGTYARLFVNRFMEAPAMFKREGRYYLIMSGCTGWAPNAGRAAVADSIWGTWEELQNPFRGEDAGVSFRSQSTFVLPVQGEETRLVYMGDRWNPKDAIDGRYIWLPVTFEGKQPVIRWMDSWTLQ